MAARSIASLEKCRIHDLLNSDDRETTLSIISETVICDNCSAYFEMMADNGNYDDSEWEYEYDANEVEARCRSPTIFM